MELDTYSKRLFEDINKNNEIFSLFKEMIPEYVIHKDYIGDQDITKAGLRNGR